MSSEESSSSTSSSRPFVATSSSLNNNSSSNAAENNNNNATTAGSNDDISGRDAVATEAATAAEDPNLVVELSLESINETTNIEIVAEAEATLLRQALGEIFDNHRVAQQQQQIHLLGFDDDDDDEEEDDEEEEENENDNEEENGGEGHDGDDHNNNNNNNDDDEEDEEEVVPPAIIPNNNNNNNLEEVEAEVVVADEVRRRIQQLQQQQNFHFTSFLSSHIEETFLLLISKFTPTIINKALLMTIPNENNLRLPIHLACEYSAPISIIKKLLEYDTTKKSILAKDVWGDLPIHIACSRGPNYSEVVKLLLDADTSKKTINVKDCNNYMPIHMACRYYSSSSSASNITTTTRYTLSRAINTPPEEIIQQESCSKTIQLLLNADKSKSTLLEEGIHGQYPIHILCRNESISTYVLKDLLEADDQINGLLSVLKADDGDRIPIHVYLTSSSRTIANNNNNKWKLDILQILLEAMIIGRIHRHGLDNWKYQLTQLCYKTLTCGIKNERDMIIQDILHIINFTLNEILLERVFVMELICWKMNLLKLIATNATDVGLLSSQQQRSEARIKSCADIIIREVLPFLEYEPIDTIMTTLEKDFFPIT